MGGVGNSEGDGGCDAVSGQGARSRAACFAAARAGDGDDDAAGDGTAGRASNGDAAADDAADRSADATRSRRRSRMSLSEDGGLVAGGGGGLAGDGERAAGDEADGLREAGGDAADGRREADGDEADGLREAGGDAAAEGLAGDTVDSVRTALDGDKAAGDTAAAAGDTAAGGDRGDRDDANDARSRRRSRMSSSDDSAAKATDRSQACLPKERGDGDGRSEFSTSARDGVAGAGPARKAAAVASSGSSADGRLGEAGAGGLAALDRGDKAAAVLNRFSQASRPFHVAALNLLPTNAPGTPTNSNSNATPFVSVAATASTRMYEDTSTLDTSAPSLFSRARRIEPSSTKWRRRQARPSAALSSSQPPGVCGVSAGAGGGDGGAGSSKNGAGAAAKAGDRSGRGLLGSNRSRSSSSQASGGDGCFFPNAGDRSGRGDRGSAITASVGDGGRGSVDDDEPVAPSASSRKASVGESGSRASKDGDGARKGGGSSGTLASSSG